MISANPTLATHPTPPAPIGLNLRLVDLQAIYRAELLERVVPFWLTHAIDWSHGGILTCIADNGQVLSTDKYMWSQLRAIWTFSALYNRIEQRPQWLQVARHIYRFVRQHGRDDQGRWVYAVDQDGQVLQGANSIYTDGFALYGLTELAQATGDPEVVDLALETYRNVQQRLAVPGSYQTEPYPLPPGVKAHGVSMIFCLAFFELAGLLEDDTILKASLQHAREVLDVYRRPQRRLLLEFVHLDNSPIDSPMGRSVVPGHAIESMGFLIRIYSHVGGIDRVRRAVECMRWHLEVGWDDEYGGLVLARDANGGTPWWPFADAKLWWPHTEALMALLLAYEYTQEPRFLNWLQRVHDYAFSHYPVPSHGEWTQKLDRRGHKFTETVALPVKDPFHLPRALMGCIEVLERMASGVKTLER